MRPEENPGTAGFHPALASMTVADWATIRHLSEVPLPRESAWVLKIVQAAVAFEATAIEVKQGKASTLLAFTPSTPLRFDSLEAALLSPTLVDVDSPLGHLVAGLRAVGFDQRRSFRLATGSGQILHWDGETLRRLTDRTAAASEPAGLSLQIDFSPEEKGRPLGASVGAARRARDEFVELVTRAGACPVPLELDGRRLNVLSSPVGVGTDGPATSREQRVAITELPDGEPPEGLELPDELKLEEPWICLTDRVADRILAEGDSDPRVAEFVLTLAYHFKVVPDPATDQPVPATLEGELSWCHWVRSGVVCYSEPLWSGRSGVSINLYLSGHGLPTDSSGLALKEVGPAGEARKRHALSLVRKSVAGLQARISGRRGTSWIGFLASGLLVGTAVVARSGSLVLTLAPVAARGAVGYQGQPGLLLVKDCQEHLRCLHERLLDSVASTP